MKRFTFYKTLAIGLLLISGNVAIAETDEASSRSPVSVGLELNRSTTKYVLNTARSEPTFAFTQASSAKLLMEEALIRIGYTISPAIEFHGILGTARPEPGGLFLLGPRNGLVVGAGISTSPQSNATWKSNFGIEVTHTNVKDSRGSEEGSGTLSFNTSNGAVTVPAYIIATGRAELQLTKIELSALATYKTGFTEPYIGALYSIARGTLKTKLRTLRAYICQSPSNPCSELDATSFTPDGKQDISLDSQMGLTLGFNAHIADAMNIGFGAIVGTRTQYSAHVELSF